MTTLSPYQIAVLAYNAGFRGNDLRMATGIALAESGGNSNAYNPETGAGTPKGEGSRGLWQIYGAAHPQFDTDKIYDPQLNAAAAYQVYREAGNKFTPWSTYNNGQAATIARNLNTSNMGSAVEYTTPSISSAQLGTGSGTVGQSQGTTIQTPRGNITIP